MGQAHLRRWIGDLLPIVSDDRDPLGVREFATHHHPPLEDAPRGYDIFRDKEEGCLKVVLQPEREPRRLTVGATVRSRSKSFFSRTDGGFTDQAGPSCRRRASSGHFAGCTEVRREMLEEAVGIIAQLFAGGQVTLAANRALRAGRRCVGDTRGLFTGSSG